MYYFPVIILLIHAFTRAAFNKESFTTVVKFFNTIDVALSSLNLNV